MERSKLKGIPFSSPPVGAAPLGRAKLLLGVQTAHKGSLCVALPRVIGMVVLLLLNLEP